MDALFLRHKYLHLHSPSKTFRLLARFGRLKLGEAVLSVMTCGELIYGVEKSQFREQATKQLAELAGLVPLMALPPQAGEF